MDGSESQNPWTPQLVVDGEWAGWGRYETDPYENLTGRFYSRRDETGQMVCAFRAEKKHMNGGGFMHGGCMSYLRGLRPVYDRRRSAGELQGSVTASLNCEFVDGAQEGDLIEARGEVVRAGGSMVFVRGLITTGDRPIANFSAIVKKIRRKG